MLNVRPSSNYGGMDINPVSTKIWCVTAALYYCKYLPYSIFISFANHCKYLIFPNIYIYHIILYIFQMIAQTIAATTGFASQLPRTAVSVIPPQME